MKRLISLMMILGLILGCSTNDPVNNNGESNPEQGEVTTPVNGDNNQGEEAQETLDHNAITPNIEYELYLLRNNEVLLEIQHVGEEDFSSLHVYLSFYEEESDEAIEKEYVFQAFNAGHTSYYFSTDLSAYTLDLELTEVRYGYGSPYALKYENLSEFISIDHAKNDQNGVAAVIKNEGDAVIEHVSVVTVYYDNGEVIGAHMRFAFDLEPDAEAVFDFYSPLDEARRILSYDDYKIGINSAYHRKP